MRKGVTSHFACTNVGITHSKEGLQILWSDHGSSKEHDHGAVSTTVQLEGQLMVDRPDRFHHEIIDLTSMDRDGRLGNRSTLKDLWDFHSKIVNVAGLRVDALYVRGYFY
jgi:hypothetical protein